MAGRKKKQQKRRKKAKVLPKVLKIGGWEEEKATKKKEKGESVAEGIENKWLGGRKSNKIRQIRRKCC